MTTQIGGTTGITFPDASTQNTAATGFGFKNRIINGAMMIDQRNAGAAVTTTSSFPVDRFYIVMSAAGKFTAQRNAGSVTPPAGFVNYLGATSTSAYTVGASEIFSVIQRIEGYNIADLAWGTASASAVTLSFKVYSSLTGTFGGSLQSSGSTRSYPFSYSVSVANTWTNVAITIPGDTAGTWVTNNGVGIQLCFGIGVGATFSGTAGSWSSGNYYSATGATSVVGTSGATFYITGVQLEKGSTATSFDYRPYGTELQLCQRYYRKTDTSALYGEGSVYGYGSAGVSIGQAVPYPVPMRAAATAAYGGTWALNNMGSTQYVVGNTSGYFPYISSAGGASSQYSNYSGYITFTAEL